MSTTSNKDTNSAASKSAATTATRSKASNTPKPTSGKSGIGISVLAILLALGSAAGTGFTWYQMQVAKVGQESQLLGDIAAIGSQVTVLGDRVAQLQLRGQELVTEAQFESTLLINQTAVTEQLDGMLQTVEQTSESVSELKSELAQGTRDIQLDDIAELLKAANVSALVLGNKQGALNALRLAEQSLQELDDIRFTPVRQKVLSDISSLEATPSLDMDALSVQIQSLVSRIELLGLQNEPEVVSDSNGTAVNVAAEPGSGVMGFFAELGRDLQNALSVKIQRVDQLPTPLLAPEQRYFLDLNISLALNKAELAALQNRAEVFAQSLEQARHWVASYYDTNDAAVIKYLAELDALATTTVAVEMPSVAQGYAEFIAIREGLN